MADSFYFKVHWINDPFHRRQESHIVVNLFNLFCLGTILLARVHREKTKFVPCKVNWLIPVGSPCKILVESNWLWSCCLHWLHGKINQWHDLVLCSYPIRAIVCSQLALCSNVYFSFSVMIATGRVIFISHPPLPEIVLNHIIMLIWKICYIVSIPYKITFGIV